MILTQNYKKTTAAAAGLSAIHTPTFNGHTDFILHSRGVVIKKKSRDTRNLVAEGKIWLEFVHVLCTVLKL